MLNKKLVSLFLISLVFALLLVGFNKVSISPIQTQVNAMTTEEKVGQMLMIGIDGDTLNDESVKFIQEHHIGGVILNRDNIKDSKQLLLLNNRIKEINEKQSNIPIFISVDEEGGLVSRMPPEINNLPKSSEIGDKNSSSLAFQVGKAIGERATAFGFNMTMAPVLDINSNPRNPVIGERSFGKNARIVTKMGIAEIKGIHSKNSISVIKHFPGHGDTSVDSHKSLPILNHNLKRLTKRELIPFKKAIDQGADMTMVAHILIPNIDRQRPSSLSKKIVTNLLREDLHFNGVIITDDLTMGAIIKKYDIGDAAVKAIEAGNDMALVCHGYENEQRAYSSILKAVKNGDITEKQINDSVYRILTLKNKYQLTDQSIPSVNIDEINKSTENIYKVLQKG